MTGDQFLSYALFGFILGLFLWAIYGRGKDLASKDLKEKLVIKKKTCPPHQWFWQEIVDQDGTKVSERIVCKVCGPLNLHNNDNETE